jgi:O-acetyl-ADP-ribose deacetylase (regulator of RNase III)
MTSFENVHRPAIVVTDVDLFSIGAQTVVNTVNCVGVMGKGIALEFRRRFPRMFADYVRRCRRGEVRPGVPYLYVDGSGTRIVNFPTKDDWRNGSEIVWVDLGLERIAERAREWNITSLALPPPGCGNGGLAWTQVGPIVEARLGQLGIPIHVCIQKK